MSDEIWNDDEENMVALNIKYQSLSVHNGKIVANSAGPTVLKKLKPGNYTLHYNQLQNVFWFEKIKFKHDDILDLPSPEYSQIVSEMKFFMDPDVRSEFNRLGFLYKRSALLHGLPGTGKTVIVNRIARDIVSMGGICLWVEQPTLLEMAYDILNDIQPETLTGVIFEEFDEIARKEESYLLTLLDGQIQKQNVVYMATTNYIEKVPKRLYRPGRFSSVIEIQYPIREARQLYLETKLGKDFVDMKLWLDSTTNFSIDELKELVQAVFILKNSLSDTIKRVVDTKNLEPTKNNNDDDYGLIYPRPKRNR